MLQTLSGIVRFRIGLVPPDELVGVHAVGHLVAARREDDVDGADGERVPEPFPRGCVAPGLERERRVAVRGDGVGLVVRGEARRRRRAVHGSFALADEAIAQAPESRAGQAHERGQISPRFAGPRRRGPRHTNAVHESVTRFTAVRLGFTW